MAGMIRNISIKGRQFFAVTGARCLHCLGDRDLGGPQSSRRAAGRFDQQAAGADRSSAAAPGAWEMFASVYGAGKKPYTKPDPRIFHDVAAELSGSGPAVMIGDSITDLIPRARRARLAS